MREPRIQDLEPELRDAARSVAGSLRSAGRQAWLVGGAVRDLALGRPVKDVDIVTDARPDEVQELFERTVEVGAAFGIVVVLVGDLEVEVATFREERGYSDARRPDEVVYADSAEVDARRRDFTCNALFLDPLDDTLLDPTGGLDDLRAGRLATVGEPTERFREDGLRLVRMARFEAALDLDPAPGLHAAATAEAHALRGVSPERVLDELNKIAGGARPSRALRTMEACGLLERIIPGWTALGRDERRVRLAALDAAESGPHDRLPIGGLHVLLALLVGDARDPAATKKRLQALRPSRAVLTETLETLRVADQIPHLAAPGARRSERLRALRSHAFGSGLALARARAAEDGGAVDRYDQLASWAESAGDPSPPLFIDAARLLAAGVEPGPGMGEILREAEDAQLDGEFEDADGAGRWLQRRLA